MNAFDASAHAATPQLLSGRYRLREKLGEGRLAAVYHATDETLQRSVLVHVLRKELADKAALVQRFQTEISASAQRSHPALLEVFDSGVSSERPFMVTDYTVGLPLRDRGVLTPEYAILYMRQITGAVALCQTRRLPHPPISSSNVLVIDEGNVKLVESWQMPPGTVSLDLVHYRAPEITEGNRPGPTSTVYALGLLLYELLSGTRPVGGKDAQEIAQAHLTLQLPGISRMRPLLYLPSLDKLLRRATARFPDQRFAEVSAFATALDGIWHDISGDTRQLLVAPLSSVGPRSQPEPHQSAPAPVPGQAPAPAPARPAPPRSAPPRAPGTSRLQHYTAVTYHYWRRQGFIHALTGWLVIMLLLVVVVVGSYLGASYLAERLFGVRIPVIDLPSINLPTIDLQMPEWLQESTEGAILIVNINEGLNMRDQPGLNTNIIAVLPGGTRVRQLEGPVVANNVPWVRVRTEGEGEALEGWMSLNFLVQEP